MYSYIVTGVNDLKKRIDIYFTVYSDGRALGDDCLCLYAENFFGVRPEDRKQFVHEAISQQCKKFMVAKDVLEATANFAELAGVETALDDIVYKPEVAVPDEPIP